MRLRPNGIVELGVYWIVTVESINHIHSRRDTRVGEITLFPLPKVEALRWLGSLYAECNQVRQTPRKKGVYGIECIERRWRITVCSAKPTDGISWRGRDLAIVMFTRRISGDDEYSWMLRCYLMKQIQSESKAKIVRWPVKLGPRSALSMECMVRMNDVLLLSTGLWR